MRIFYRRRSLGSMLIVISIVFFTFGIKNAADKSVPESYYTTVNAVIIEKYQSPIAELESFADVSYTDLSGIERTGRIEYNGSANVGDVIQIDMSTHNPELIGFATPEAATRQTAEKSQNKRYAAIEIAVGVLLFALGIFLTVRRMKARQVPEETTVPPAETVGTVPVSETRDGVSNYEIEKILKKIDRQFPPKPMVELTPKRAENLSVFENKLGGVPYMPADFEYPKGRSGIFEGRPLRLLAQLNFEKLPHIENFPEKGILQFFCSDDEEDCAYGLDFDNAVSQNGFRVIYHENVIADESRLMPKESMPIFTDNLGNFPFKGEFLLEAGTEEMCPVSYEDYRFFNEILKQLGELTGKEIKTLTEAEEAGFGNEFWEKLYEARICEHTCIGGYPFFTQDDLRSYKKEFEDYDVLLFQCSSSYEDNSEDEIMWGDMGVANFFITEKDLKKRDFSRVAYNWDCC